MTEDEMYEIISGYEESERDYHERNIELENENAKLKELVQGLWFVADYLGMNPDGVTGRSFARQMRELGIEVC